MVTTPVLLAPAARRLLSPLLLLLVLGLGSPGCGARSEFSDVQTEISGAGGSASGGAAGAGPGGTGGIGGGVSLECDLSQIAVVGSLDGQAVALKSDFYHAFASSTPGTSYVASFSDRGFLRVPAPSGSGTFPAKEIMLSLPPEAPSPGLWLCDPKSEAVTVEMKDSLSLSLSVGLHDLRRLGACPGTPVADELEYCDPAIVFCGDILFGELAGAPFAPELDIEVSGPTNEEHLVGFQGGGMLALELPPSAMANTGVFVTPSTGPDPGAVYCIGKISPGADAAHLKLTNLSRLGSCAEGTPAGGSLAVCLAW